MAETNVIGPPAGAIAHGAPGGRRAWGAVCVLGLALFAFVSTELMPVGLLPAIAHGIGVPVGRAGFLVTGFAFVVAVAATPMTMLLRRLDRRKLVGLLLAVCTAGNILTAVSVNYWMLLASRIVVALAIGVMWSNAVAFATRLAPERHAVRATSLVLSGLSVAGVAGIPLGTLLGQAAGWRVTFVALAILSAVVMIAGLALLPPTAPAEMHAGNGGVGTVLRHPGLRAAIATTAMVMTGCFLAYTYITPYLARVAHASPGLVGVLLIVYGAAGVLGTFLIGPLLHRSLSATLLGTLTVMSASLIVCGPRAPCSPSWCSSSSAGAPPMRPCASCCRPGSCARPSRPALVTRPTPCTSAPSTAASASAPSSAAFSSTAPAPTHSPSSARSSPPPPCSPPCAAARPRDRRHQRKEAMKIFLAGALATSAGPSSPH